VPEGYADGHARDGRATKWYADGHASDGRVTKWHADGHARDGQVKGRLRITTTATSFSFERQTFVKLTRLRCPTILPGAPPSRPTAIRKYYDLRLSGLLCSLGPISIGPYIRGN
jgi:hypothetical protein